MQILLCVIIHLMISIMVVSIYGKTKNATVKKISLIIMALIIPGFIKLKKKTLKKVLIFLLRVRDSNPRPGSYEPPELTICSNPRYKDKKTLAKSQGRDYGTTTLPDEVQTFFR